MSRWGTNPRRKTRCKLRVIVVAGGGGARMEPKRAYVPDESEAAPPRAAGEVVSMIPARGRCPPYWVVYEPIPPARLLLMLGLGLGSARWWSCRTGMVALANSRSSRVVHPLAQRWNMLMVLWCVAACNR